MAGPESQIEWYLARDGAQHGPLSDVEMRKFVEFGHLKPSDLVWRAGFPEWRPSTHVFPELASPPRPAATLPVVQPVVQAVAQPAAQPTIKPVAEAPASLSDSLRTSPRTEPAQAKSPEADAPRTAGLQRGLRRLGSPQPVGAPADQPQFSQPQFSQQFEPAQIGPASHSGPGQSGTVQPRAAIGRRGANRPGADTPNFAGQEGPQEAHKDALHAWAPAAGSGLQLKPARSDSAGLRAELTPSRDDDDDAEPEPRRSFVRTAAFAAGALILLGAGWIGWQNRSAFPGMSAIGGVMLARISAAPSPELYQAAPFVADGATRDDIDRALQKTALWRLLKRDYADWYGERVGDIERMRTQKSDEKTISKFIADVVVVQRRKTAPIALSSSPEHLRQIASAFLGNLGQLAARDAQSCFGFISFGEASAYMLELSKTSTFAEPLQRQLTAIFEAVADGRKQPKYYAATRRTDYDVLTAELTARGWTQDDLLTFSDARRLSSSPPEKVCRMVQDWFTVQLALKDTELQGRLLAESLKPLVQG